MLRCQNLELREGKRVIFVAALDCRYRTAVGTQALACLKTALSFLHQTSPAGSCSSPPYLWRKAVAVAQSGWVWATVMSSWASELALLPGSVPWCPGQDLTSLDQLLLQLQCSHMLSKTWYCDSGVRMYVCICFFFRCSNSHLLL